MNFTYDLAAYAMKYERINEIHVKGLKVIVVFEVVVRLLRKFLVGHSIIPIFENMLSLILLD